MSIGTVFVNNRTQAVRLPVDVRLPEGCWRRPKTDPLKAGVPLQN